MGSEFRLSFPGGGARCGWFSIRRWGVDHGRGTRYLLACLCLVDGDVTPSGLSEDLRPLPACNARSDVPPIWASRHLFQLIPVVRFNHTHPRNRPTPHHRATNSRDLFWKIPFTVKRDALMRFCNHLIPDLKTWSICSFLCFLHIRPLKPAAHWKTRRDATKTGRSRRVLDLSAD